MHLIDTVEKNEFLFILSDRNEADFSIFFIGIIGLSYANQKLITDPSIATYSRIYYGFMRQ